MSDLLKEEKKEDNWENLSYEEKNEQLFQHEKMLLEMFLSNGAISRQQYEKSIRDLIEKTGHVITVDFDYLLE